MSTITINPFAALLDPVSVLAACQRSGALTSLPLSARRDADQPAKALDDDLAEHDAAIEAQFIKARR